MRRSSLVAALLVACGGGSTPPATGGGTTSGGAGTGAGPTVPEPTQPVPPGPYRLDFACSVDARHFGGHHTAQTYEADLAAGTSGYFTLDEPPGPPEPQDDVAPAPRRPLDGITRAHLEQLARAVLVRSDWPSDPGIADGEVCSLVITRGTTQLFTAQRQEQTRGDAVDQLIRALQALPH